MDELYQVNQRFWSTDMFNYIKRKAYSYDWSVLIPTMPGREQGLQRLMNSLYEKVGRIAPDLRMEICMDFDNRESSIGMKRQRLLERAKGKYLSFIDDDDEITDAYIEDLWACIQGNYHTMRIRGQMSQYQFVHSVDIKLTDMMATNDEIPYFQRPPNHLNPMLSDVAKLIPFKNAVHGEDLDWTINLYKHRFLSYEYQSDPSRIHYVYNLGTRVVQPETIKLQQTVSYETMLGLVFSPSGDAIAQQPQAPRQQGTTLKLGTRGFVISK
jgi:glycosyltransferase involved in cell wall biosynthesis